MAAMPHRVGGGGRSDCILQSMGLSAPACLSVPVGLTILAGRPTPHCPLGSFRRSFEGKVHGESKRAAGQVHARPGLVGR